MSSDFFGRMVLTLVLGATLQAAWLIVELTPGVESNPAHFLFVLGYLLVILGCAYVAESRGLSRWFGLCGLASVLGLLVLWSIPLEEDKSKHTLAGAALA